MSNDTRTYGCGDLEQVLAAAWKGELPPREQAALDQHLAGCDSCRVQADVLEDLWLSLSLDDEAGPGDGLRARVLQAGNRALAFPGVAGGHVGAPGAMSQRWWMMAAAAILCVAVGLGVGRALPDTRTERELAVLRDELRSVRQVMTLSLIQQASATERLQAVAMAAQIDRPGAEVRDALLEALANDGNVNVRLAAIDALRGLMSDERVREQLIDSARDQASPLVQVAVIDALVERREVSASSALRAIADDARVSTTVRQRARRALGQLQAPSTRS